MRRAPALLLTLLLAGCGNDRTTPPDLDTPVTPAGERSVRIQDARLRFTAPGNWQDLPAAPPRVGGVRSGRATVAVWRYPRVEPLPRTTAELRRVRDLLLERVRRRDPSFDERSARVLRRDGVPAIELVARQTIRGVPVSVRSTHLYYRRAEVVIDAYAPPAQFDRVDAGVFLPLLRSLRISA